MITDKDISVVVQGAIVSKGNITINVCESIRKFLPKAEIVLSTWKGCDTSNIDYDILIENEDPGNLDSYYNGHEVSPVANNFNRQLVSTVNGIKASRRKFVMKLRSDSMLVGAYFLKIYNEYDECAEKIACFEPRNPWGNFRDQLSLCDFWFFSSKCNLLELWDIELYRNNIVEDRDILGEEYLMAKYVEKKKRIPLTNFVINADKYKNSVYKDFIENKFMIMPARKSGIRCYKYPEFNDFKTVCIKHYVISFSDWMSFQKIKNPTNTLYHIMHLLEVFSGNIILKLKRLKIWKK